MSKKKYIDPELVRKLFYYSHHKGKLFWRKRGKEQFKTETRWKSWNKTHPGTVAGSVSPTYYYPKNGPRRFKRNQILVGINGSNFVLARVIWVYMTGHNPDQIDHINGDSTDNRFCNLRNVDATTNGRNRKRYTRNTSGYNGVYLVKAKLTKPWTGHVPTEDRYPNGRLKKKRIGYFHTKEEAVAARDKLIEGKGFTDRHGKSIKKEQEE